MTRRRRVSLLAGGALLAGLLALSGCSTLGYYWQSINGHLALMNAARPVDELLVAPSTPATLRDKLALTQRIRDFASRELHLPDNPSYRRYADLHRTAAVWNVVAAPVYSLELQTWCFPVAGCVGYRGYYNEAKAREEARRLAGLGYEADAYPVPAYSTLGYLNWAGGDPLLSTFIQYPEGELARLLFHELAHQVLYVQNDTTFNESFAVAVERLGGERWLREHATEAARRDYAAYDARRQQFRQLTRATRARLEAVYETPGLSPEEKEKAKQAVMARFRADYARMRAGWGDVEPRLLRAYDRRVAEANNAYFGTLKAYDELVPGFIALFHQSGDDWNRFYDAARRLSRLTKNERHEKLKELAGG